MLEKNVVFFFSNVGEEVELQSDAEDDDPIEDSEKIHNILILIRLYIIINLYSLCSCSSYLPNKVSAKK